MTRRRCPCARIIEAEDDPASVAHAVKVHSEVPEHREYVALLAELAPSYEQVKAELRTRLVRVA